MARKIKIEGIGNDFLKTCPVCGYSFRVFDPTTKKVIKNCPMCGHKFIEPDFPPDRNQNFKKRFF